MKVKILLVILGATLSLATFLTISSAGFIYLGIGLFSLLMVDFVQKKPWPMKLRLAVTALLFALYYIMLSRELPSLEPYWIVLTMLTMVVLVVLKGLKR